MNKLEKAYGEIINTLEKYNDICNYDISAFKCKAKYHLFGNDLKEKYGLNIDPKQIRSLDFIRLNEYCFISQYGEKYKRTISWEDNNKQPEDEILFGISFPTGAYILGDDYPKELFKEFWHELKSYNPKYIDTANNSLYFSLDNSKNIFNKFQNVLQKYKDKYKKEEKNRKIEKLKKELKKLED